MKDPQDGEDERANDASLVAEPQSFGTWLRRQREVREIDLREIADSTKVSMSYLRGFEEDRFDVLPAPVFAKGFLRQYARYVGLDPEEAVNFYLAAREPEDDEPSLQPGTEPESPPASNYLFFVIAVTAALVLLVWLLSIYGDRKREGASGSPPSVPEAAVVEPRETLPAAVAAEGTPEPSSPAPKPEPPAVDPGPPLRVTLDFLSDCWVEASVDGAKRLSELKVQGESLLLDAEEVVEFKVGDVGAVQVEVNGLPFEIEGRRGTSVRTVRIDLEAAAAVAAVEGGSAEGSEGSGPGAVEDDDPS